MTGAAESALPNGSDRIPLAEPALLGNEAEYLAECVRTNFVSSVGPFVQRFETAFADRLEAPHAVACSSGTAALHVALRVAGVRPGDVVAVSDLTFIASANAIRYLGAEPLLVDSERETWNLDSERLHAYVTKRARQGEALPAAIVPVHVLGRPASLEPLLDLRTSFGIPIVEDAAEALGASHTIGTERRPVGTTGDFGCFSFNGNKIITSGGGGMIVTGTDESAVRARHLTTQAKVDGRAYQHDTVGYNYRLTNIAAAVGLAQLEQLDDFLAAKAAIAARYDRAFADLPLDRPTDRAGGAIQRMALLDPPCIGSESDRDRVLDRLSGDGIQARPLWPPLHLQRPYASSDRVGPGTVAEDLYERGLSLPCSVGLGEAQQQRVVDAVRRAVAR